MTTATSPRLHFRRFTLAALAAISAGGVVCAGAGAGSAEPIGPEGISGVSSDSAQAVPWTVMNGTPENVWGSIQRQRGRTYTGIGWEKSAPAKPGEKAGTWSYDTTADILNHDVKYWGRICYHDKWWNMGDPTAYYFTYPDLVILPTQEGGLVIKSDGHGIADEKTVPLKPTPGDSGCGTP